MNSRTLIRELRGTGAVTNDPTAMAEAERQLRAMMSAVSPPKRPRPRYRQRIVIAATAATATVGLAIGGVLVATVNAPERVPTTVTGTATSSTAPEPVTSTPTLSRTWTKVETTGNVDQALPVGLGSSARTVVVRARLRTTAWYPESGGGAWYSLRELSGVDPLDSGLSLDELNARLATMGTASRLDIHAATFEDPDLVAALPRDREGLRQQLAANRRPGTPADQAVFFGAASVLEDGLAAPDLQTAILGLLKSLAGVTAVPADPSVFGLRATSYQLAVAAPGSGFWVNGVVFDANGAFAGVDGTDPAGASTVERIITTRGTTLPPEVEERANATPDVRETSAVASSASASSAAPLP